MRQARVKRVLFFFFLFLVLFSFVIVMRPAQAKRVVFLFCFVLFCFQHEQSECFFFSVFIIQWGRYLKKGLLFLDHQLKWEDQRAFQKGYVRWRSCNLLICGITHFGPFFGGWRCTQMWSIQMRVLVRIIIIIAMIILAWQVLSFIGLAIWPHYEMWPIRLKKSLIHEHAWGQNSHKADVFDSWDLCNTFSPFPFYFST